MVEDNSRAYKDFRANLNIQKALVETQVQKKKCIKIESKRSSNRENSIRLLSNIGSVRLKTEQDLPYGQNFLASVKG